MYTHVTCGRIIQRRMNHREPLSFNDKNQEAFDRLRTVLLEGGSADVPMFHVTIIVSMRTMTLWLLIFNKI